MKAVLLIDFGSTYTKVTAVDVETEEKVLQRIRALPDRTCVAVTHRPAAIALCDLHLEVAEGKILVRKIEK